MSKRRAFTGLLHNVMLRHVSPERADLIAERTGIHERTIHALRRGESGAWFENTLLPILAELGPAAWNDILSHLGLCGVHYLDNKGVSERRFMASASAVVAEIARATADDGQINHVEAPRILKALEPVMEDAPALAQQMRKKGAA